MVRARGQYRGAPRARDRRAAPAASGGPMGAREGDGQGQGWTGALATKRVSEGPRVPSKTQRPRKSTSAKRQTDRMPQIYQKNKF